GGGGGGGGGGAGRQDGNADLHRALLASVDAARRHLVAAVAVDEMGDAAARVADETDRPVMLLDEETAVAAGEPVVHHVARLADEAVPAAGDGDRQLLGPAAPAQVVGAERVPPAVRLVPARVDV